jgi:tetratricopeptide (TPR) repeat protein
MPKERFVSAVVLFIVLLNVLAIFPSLAQLDRALDATPSNLAPAEAPLLLASATTPKADEGLRAAVNAVLEQRFLGIDTAALMQTLKQRAHWGESDSRFIEAEAVLHFIQGDWNQAFVLLRRVARPSAGGLAILAECMQRKGEVYEAAAYHLRAASAYAAQPIARIRHLREYLEIFPDKADIRIDLAQTLAAAEQFSEAADIYLKHETRWSHDTAQVESVSSWLQQSGRYGELEGLLKRARVAHPDHRGLALRHAELLGNLGERRKASEAWMALWKSEPLRADWGRHVFIHTEAQLKTWKPIPSVPSENRDTSLWVQPVLEAAAAIEPGNGAWRGLLVQACLHQEDTACAYREASTLVDHPDFAAILQQVVRSDAEILTHFEVLKKGFDPRHADVQWAAKVARGHSLQGQNAEACKLWLKIRERDVTYFASRAEAANDLASCREKQAAVALTEVAPKASLAGLSEQALAQTAEALLQTGRTASALPMLRQLVHGHGEGEGGRESKVSPAARMKAQWLLAEALASQGDTLAAAREGQQAHEALNSAGKAINASQAEKLLQWHAATTPRQERAWLEILHRHGRLRIEQKVRLGLLRFDDGDHAQASELLRPVLRDPMLGGGNEAKKNPGPPKPHSDPLAAQAGLAGLQVGRYLASRRNWDPAIEALSLGIKHHPDSLADHMLLARALAARQRYEEAVGAFELASRAELASQDADFQQERFKAAQHLRDAGAILRAATAIADLDPDSYDMQRQAGFAYLPTHDFDGSQRFFARMTLLAPEKREGWEWLGISLAAAGDLQTAAEPLQKAIDLGSVREEVFIHRARAYREVGEKDMAESMLSFLLSQNPRSYLALVWSARFAKSDGADAAANEYLRKASLHAPQGLSPDDTAAPMLGFNLPH